jgi:D-alanine-D-alanine ligase
MVNIDNTIMSDNLKTKKILVVMGGPSDEKEISLKSGRTILMALKDIGLNAAGLEIPGDNPSRFFREKLREIRPDVCFLALHGRFGEDGKAQEILSGLGIPYTGSGPQASLKAFNKLSAKEIFLKNGIPTPPYFVFKKGDSLLNGISCPLVVKPACQGSTIGVKAVDRKGDLPLALEEAFIHGDAVLIEKFIKGRELTVGILGDKALPVVEIKSNQTLFDYNAKYHAPDTDYIVPAKISLDSEVEIKRLGLLVHNSLGLKDFSRIDLILRGDGTPFILEANTIPGLSERSLFPLACKAAGMSFEEMCCILLEMSLCAKK